MEEIRQHTASGSQHNQLQKTAWMKNLKSSNFGTVLC
jgi:hypothetical protein